MNRGVGNATVSKLWDIVSCQHCMIEAIFVDMKMYALSRQFDPPFSVTVLGTSSSNGTVICAQFYFG